jgi:transposase
MRAYSQDLRLRVIQAVDAGQSKAASARRYAVSLSSVKRYVARRDSEGHVRAKTSPGAPPRINPSEYPAVIAQVRERPDATLAEHAELWEQRHGVRVSQWAIGRIIRRLKLTRKKRH